MSRKTKIIILIIIIIILLIIACLQIFKNNKEEEKTSYVATEYVSDIETVKEQETEINSSIIEALAEVEEDYQSALSNYSGYKRADFYNESRINKAMSSGEVSFVNVNEINTDELFNTDGEQIEEISEVIFNETEIEPETDSNITAGKYYLIRYESGSMYNYYYVMTINNQGKASIEWLCYTENEITDSELLEEMEIENTIEY